MPIIDLSISERIVPSPIDQLSIRQQSALSNQQFLLSLRLVLVGADGVFGGGDGIVGETLVVDAWPVWVADLFVARTIAFDRAFVDVLIVLLLCRHHGHVCSLAAAFQARGPLR